MVEAISLIPGGFRKDEAVYRLGSEFPVSMLPNLRETSTIFKNGPDRSSKAAY